MIEKVVYDWEQVDRILAFNAVQGGSKVISPSPLVRVVRTGKHQHRNQLGRGILPEMRENRETIAPTHPKVGNDQRWVWKKKPLRINTVPVEIRNRFFCIGDKMNGQSEPGSIQRPADKKTIPRVIIDDQNGAAAQFHNKSDAWRIFGKRTIRLSSEAVDGGTPRPGRLVDFICREGTRTGRALVHTQLFTKIRHPLVRAGRFSKILAKAV